MIYTFYSDTNYDVCRTANSEPTNLTGNNIVERRTESAIYTDKFHVLGKIKSVYGKEDGLWYDFYAIDRHTQVINRIPYVDKQDEKNKSATDYVAMMAGI